MYLHVCVTAAGFCLQNRDPICETSTVSQGSKVTFIHIKNCHAHYQEESPRFLQPKGIFLLLLGCPLITKENRGLNSQPFPFKYLTAQLYSS